MATEFKKVRLRFDGAPGPEAPRFIEAELESGASVRVGTWRKDEKSDDWFLDIIANVHTEDVEQCLVSDNNRPGGCGLCLCRLPKNHEGNHGRFAHNAPAS